uniref:Truncated ICARUS1 n=1 Tax=Arabidopsis thaliana TaxID=3702 RepID=A0A0F7Q2M9_ARATH|nr:truncated ICARUS1 [Arabidopsis thaliana]AKI05705.1 truncated ICARUS1 [Arabidopsis thaliana]AKI05709.1 truncated ICARUS1 [Arabidopsis thaliana]AKI05710.1 truncated ICARUS1 [Arabidopsis thaliana]AKI05711.1 truncated ICARUS1 [Arabidopsis thaliana]
MINSVGVVRKEAENCNCLQVFLCLVVSKSIA